MNYLPKIAPSIAKKNFSVNITWLLFLIRYFDPLFGRGGVFFMVLYRKVVGGRQADCKNSPFSFFAFNRDKAAVVFDNSKYSGQPKASALLIPNFFGGKKRIKYFFLGFVIHTDSVIFDGYPYIAARIYFKGVLVVLLDKNVLGADNYFTFTNHCLGGIDEDIQADLLHLGMISVHAVKLFFKGFMDADIFSGGFKHL